ncbi:UNKNOWN [Stylonychia lemnae]|uniref:t-SNARE coiled-coil homology domain-containing protein n=1 Tax=Stylonychia lemnae TaxID=5949 RepID=A0A078AF26_STYLE|nr:UNKNOWN [Stylonychia lemnae]|eukprot:CDW80820.1 UNKNOWN [Stylonychia lemnae]
MQQKQVEVARLTYAKNIQRCLSIHGSIGSGEGMSNDEQPEAFKDYDPVGLAHCITHNTDKVDRRFFGYYNNQKLRLIMQTNERLSNLSKSVGLVKKITLDIKNVMVDDESLVTDIDKGLIKNQTMLSQTMGRIDKMLTSASGNRTSQNTRSVFLRSLVEAPYVSSKPPKSHRGYSSHTASHQGIDYYKSLQLNALIDQKSIKPLRRVQVERIHKILESQLDKDLYEIIKKKMAVRLPKILTQKNVDESIASNQVKNEIKRRRKIRRDVKKQFKLDLRTSSFPKTYTANYFDSYDPEGKNIINEESSSARKSARAQINLLIEKSQRDSSPSQKSKVQFQNQKLRGSQSQQALNFINQEDHLEVFNFHTQDHANTKNMTLRQLIEKRKANAGSQTDINFVIANNQEEKSNQQSKIINQKSGKNIIIQQKSIIPEAQFQFDLTDQNTTQFQYQSWKSDQQDEVNKILRKTYTQQSNLSLQNEQKIQQYLSSLRTTKVKQFEFDGLAREKPFYEKIDIEKLLLQAKKMEKKKQLFKV